MSDKPPTTADAPAERKTAFCHKCGNGTLHDSLYCRHCGADLAAPLPDSVLPSQLSVRKPRRLLAYSIFTAALLLAGSIAAVFGYMLAKNSGPNYTYVHEGNVQFRVDSRSGRTDRLGGGGWEPFSYDKPSEKLPASGVTLTNGTWESTPPPGRICFDAQNNSSTVLENLRISVSFDPKPADYPSGAGVENSDDPLDTLFGEYSTLKPEHPVLRVRTLLGVGKDGRVCGIAPRAFPTGAKWSYTVQTMRGWKER